MRITLGDRPTVTVSGVLTPVDDEAAAIRRAAEQARALGRPIRARIAAAGAVRRLIVSTDAAVTVLDTPTPAPHNGTGTTPGTQTTKATTKPRGGGQRILTRFPHRLRPVIRWGAPLMAVLVLASVVVMVLHDRSASAQAAGAAPTAPLDTAPRVGPVVLDVDGAQAIAVAGTRDLTYWPLTGGPETAVPLPAAAKVTATGMITLPNNQLGYLHAGALQVVNGLPRTTPGVALDGAVVVTQDDNGTWWTLANDTAPKGTQPRKPTGATGFGDALAVGADQVLLAWTTADPRTGIVAAYDRATGTLTATTTAPVTALPRNHTTYQAAGQLAGAGPVIQTGRTITVVPGLTVTRVVDQIYGTLHGDDVTVNTTGTTTPLPPGTLQPVNQTGDRALVVGATNKLYALKRVIDGGESGG